MASVLLDDAYYDGSRLFSWVSDLSGLPLDQVNFLISQFVALGLAPLFRSVLHPSTTGPAARHAFGLILGLIFGYFCFGMQAIHLAGLPALCYIVMRTQDPHIMQRMVLAVALVYLSCIHLHRQVYDYGSYTLDITGPLMVITQKVTSLAFSLHDGLTRKEEELTDNQKYHVVKKMPTALEYFSYMFHFQALMCGPIIFYRDYMDFIYGYNFFKYPPPTLVDDQTTNKIAESMLKVSLNAYTIQNINHIHLQISTPDIFKNTKGTLDNNSNSRKVVLEPSPCIVVFKKVVCSLLCALIFIKLIPSFPITRVKESAFVEDVDIIDKTAYLIIATSLVRFKYYHAWLLADAICNASGLGFNGYDKNGNARWDLISNVDVIKFELGSSLHDSIEQWNKGTTRWLRMTVYERAPYLKTVLTYALSALWHGFYPGYYLTFMSGALFTFAGRSVRRCIRHYFISSPINKAVYDLLTMITTRIVMGYVTFSFVLLEFWPSIKLYLHMYLWLHVLGILAMTVLPRLFPPIQRRHGAVSSKPISNGVAAKPND